MALHSWAVPECGASTMESARHPMNDEDLIMGRPIPLLNGRHGGARRHVTLAAAVTEGATGLVYYEHTAGSPFARIKHEHKPVRRA